VDGKRVRDLGIDRGLLRRLVKVPGHARRAVLRPAKVIYLGAECVERIERVFHRLAGRPVDVNIDREPPLRHSRIPISSRSLSRLRQSSTTFTKEFQEDLFAQKFFDITRAFVPTSFIRKPPLPTMIFFCE
jgi:hypothetical protein